MSARIDRKNLVKRSLIISFARFSRAIADCSAGSELDLQDVLNLKNRGAGKDALKVDKREAAYSNLAVSNYYVTGDFKSSCANIKKSASLECECQINLLNSEEDQW